jgi:thymidylate kinase
VRHFGKLYAFEGPDGVGKSELSRRFAGMLEQEGIPIKLLTFPGKEAGTVGRLVYDFHHAPQAFGVAKVATSSLQLMHIAAHIDAIENVILPTLRDGVSVVLDRFWWSTKVYGLAGGSEARLLQSMIDVELSAWGQVRPSVVFLITRRKPLRPEPEGQWQRWRDLYKQVAAEEQNKTKVVRVDNDDTIEEAVRQLKLALKSLNRQQETAASAQLPLNLPDTRPSTVSPPAVFSGLSPVSPTVVYDTYWRLAAERQEIFFKRWRREAPPWTPDRILSEFKFTNAYRASDRVSQYLIKEVIYRGEQSEEEVFFRTILFKLFNKIETWELLKKSFGTVTYADFDLKAYDKALSRASGGGPIYSAAYIMPSGSSAFWNYAKTSGSPPASRSNDGGRGRIENCGSQKHAGGIYVAAFLSHDRRFPRISICDGPQLQHVNKFLGNGIRRSWAGRKRRDFEVFPVAWWTERIRSDPGGYGPAGNGVRTPRD